MATEFLNLLTSCKVKSLTFLEFLVKFCFVHFQNIVILYEVVGNYPAPSFFAINATTGVISLQRDLKQDYERQAEYKVRGNEILWNL